jgi:Icc-related predicted phosphoesterase
LTLFTDRCCSGENPPEPEELAQRITLDPSELILHKNPVLAYLEVARHRVNPQILQALSGEAEDTCIERIRELAKLPFIKPQKHDTLLLHDVVCQLFQDYWWKKQDPLENLRSSVVTKLLSYYENFLSDSSALSYTAKAVYNREFKKYKKYQEENPLTPHSIEQPQLEPSVKDVDLNNANAEISQQNDRLEQLLTQDSSSPIVKTEPETVEQPLEVEHGSPNQQQSDQDRHPEDVNSIVGMEMGMAIQELCDIHKASKEEHADRDRRLDNLIELLRTRICDQDSGLKKPKKVKGIHTSQPCLSIAQAIKERPEYAVLRPIRILHLSDLHFGPDDDIEEAFGPLENDLKNTGVWQQGTHLDFLVISGDLTKRAIKNEFKKAKEFIERLLRSFDHKDNSQCIIVPGNHDLSWDEDVYTWRSARTVKASFYELIEGFYYAQGDGYLLLNRDKYPLRFQNFSTYLYEPVFQKPYPLDEREQCGSFLFPNIPIQFLTLNSCWRIDEFFPKRPEIQPGALSRGLTNANKRLKAENLAQDSVLRVAVLHHPISGNDKITNDGFVQQLRKANVKIVLHGHIHEDRADRVDYLEPEALYDIGAGSFGAIAKDRPPSTPRLYHLLEISPDLNSCTVYTRCREKEGGSWDAWANYKIKNDPHTKRASYTFPLENNRKQP